jgi:predicted ATP-grasp superfamily ATP-dependent carboligase
MGMAATGLSYVRSLHRHGIPTLLVNERGWIGTPSRYELTVDLPPIKDSADIWLRTLVAAAERSSRRPVLLVAFDQAVLFVGEHAQELERHYDFLIPPLETAAAIVDKHRQYELAAAAGVPIPRTVSAESGEGGCRARIRDPVSVPAETVRRLRHRKPSRREEERCRRRCCDPPVGVRQAGGRRHPLSRPGDRPRR